MSVISTGRGFFSLGPIFRGPTYYGCLGSGVAAGALGAVGGITGSGEIGTLAVVNPLPINRIPPEEVMLVPPDFVWTVPGPNIYSSGKPVYVEVIIMTRNWQP